MNIVKFNINVGGGLFNHIVIKEEKVYRFVEDGLMIYKYDQESIDILIDKILEKEYDDNLNEDNIENLIEKYDI